MSRWPVFAVEFDMRASSVWLSRDDFWTEYRGVTPASLRRLLRAIEQAPVVAVLTPAAGAAPSELVSGQLGLGLTSAAGFSRTA